MAACYRRRAISCFQGQGTGEFAAYAADSGRKLWSIRSGSAINAVPVTFRFEDDQYVIVPVGWGSVFRLVRDVIDDGDAESKYGPTRLLAFKLGATKTYPFRARRAPEVPGRRKQSYSEDAVKRGEELAGVFSCTDCHSPRLEGSGRWVVRRRRSGPSLRAARGASGTGTRSSSAVPIAHRA